MEKEKAGGLWIFLSLFLFCFFSEMLSLLNQKCFTLGFDRYIVNYRKELNRILYCFMPARFGAIPGSVIPEITC